MNEQNQQDAHMLFTDGSSLGNPGPGGWAAILVLTRGYVIEMGAGEKHTTNNRMELFGVISGLRRIANESGDLIIFTDSKYVHKGATEWADGWRRRGWKTMAKTDVENRDLWEDALLLLEQRKKFGRISWKHVPGHSGMAGNERCDEIATGFAREDMPGLYQGDLGDYAIDILNIAIDEEKSQKRSEDRARARMKAYSYLSLVGGIAMRHTIWADCEKRVKGKSGVKYKKALSPDDESAILRSWGATLS